MNRYFVSSVLIITPFLAVTLATSRKQIEGPPLNYSVNSNCSNATMVSGTITSQWSYVANVNNIVSPPNTTFLSLGLPYANIDIGQENILTAEIAPALSRSCYYSKVLVNDVSSHIYTCYNNSIASCTVSLTVIK